MHHRSPMPQMGAYPSPHLAAILPKKTKKILASYHKNASQMASMNYLYDDPKLQALRSSFQSWRSVSLAWSFLAVILLASKWYEIHKEVELLTNIDRNWLNMTSLMVNVSTTATESLATSDTMSTITTSIPTLITDQKTDGADTQEKTSGQQQMNLSQMIITKNANLKTDIDIFLVEFKNARSTLMLSFVFVIVYILSWSWMSIAIRETRVSNDISLKTILLLSIFAAVDVAASVGFVMVRLIMYSVKNNSFSNNMMTAFTIKSETVDQVAAMTALRLVALRSCSAYVDVFVSVIIGLLTILRVYSVACALSYYRRMRNGIDIGQHQQIYSYYQQMAQSQPYYNSNNNSSVNTLTNHTRHYNPSLIGQPPSPHHFNGNIANNNTNNNKYNSMLRSSTNIDNNNNNNHEAPNSNNSHLLLSSSMNHANHQHQHQQQHQQHNNINNNNDNNNNTPIKHINQNHHITKANDGSFIITNQNNHQNQIIGYSYLKPQQHPTTKNHYTLSSNNHISHPPIALPVNIQSPVNLATIPTQSQVHHQQNSSPPTLTIIHPKSNVNNQNLTSVQAIPVHLLQSSPKTNEGVLLSPHNTISLNPDNQDYSQETFARTNLLIGRSSTATSSLDSGGPYKTLLLMNHLIAEPLKINSSENDDNTIFGVNKEYLQNDENDKRILARRSTSNQATNSFSSSFEPIQEQDQLLTDPSLLSQMSMIEHIQIEEDDFLTKSINANHIVGQHSSCEQRRSDIVNIDGNTNHSSLLIDDGGTHSSSKNIELRAKSQ